MEKNKNGHIRSLVTLALLFVAMLLLLFGLHSLTGDKIANRKAQNMQNALVSSYEQFDSAEEQSKKIHLVGCADAVFKIYNAEHILQGFAVTAGPSGVGGEIELFVCMDKNAKIIGVHILSAAQTTGISARIFEESFLSQFDNKSGNLVANKDIDLIAGATASSKNVLRGVNDATATCRIMLGLEEQS